MALRFGMDCELSYGDKVDAGAAKVVVVGVTGRSARAEAIEARIVPKGAAVR